MKRLLLFLVTLFGLSKADIFGTARQNSTECILVKTQQCLADLFKAAPLLFVSGKESVDIKTRKEFGKCVLEITSCSTKLHDFTAERSQKQRDFCGDNEDCYDEEDDEEVEGGSKYAAFARCFLKHKKLYFEVVADSALDVLGTIGSLFLSKAGVEVMNPNKIMCRLIKHNLTSMKRISDEKCGDGGDVIWLITVMQLKSTVPYVYELCSLGSLMKEMVL